MTTVQKIFSDVNGTPSSMRVLVSFVVVAQIVVWAFCSIKAGLPQPLDLENAMSIIGPMIVQVWQKGKEVSGAIGTGSAS